VTKNGTQRKTSTKVFNNVGKHVYKGILNNCFFKFLACMLSALKANNIPISPYRVRLALENTAKVPKTGSFSPFSLGNGLVQVRDINILFFYYNIFRLTQRWNGLKIIPISSQLV
jgi:hypothetical protein